MTYGRDFVAEKHLLDENIKAAVNSLIANFRISAGVHLRKVDIVWVDDNGKPGYVYRTITHKTGSIDRVCIELDL